MFVNMWRLRTYLYILILEIREAASSWMTPLDHGQPPPTYLLIVYVLIYLSLSQMSKMRRGGIIFSWQVQVRGTYKFSFSKHSQPTKKGTYERNFVVYIYKKLYINSWGSGGCRGGVGGLWRYFPEQGFVCINTSHLKSNFIPKPTRQLYMLKNIWI